MDKGGIFKSFLLTLLLLLSISTISFSQKFSMGIQAGPVVSNMSKIKLPDGVVDGFQLDRRIGYQFNVQVSYKITERFGVSSELGFLQKGYHSKSFSTGITEEENTRFNYASLPLLLDCYIIKGVVISVGPEFGQLINTKVKRSNGDRFTIDWFPTKKFDAALLLSLYMGLSEKLGTGIRYSRSLTYAFRSTDTTGMHYRKRYNTYFSVFLRYKL